jgi:tetratricopeptide (TPR) repeat protein
MIRGRSLFALLNPLPLAFALAWACIGAAPTFAQDANNDYYKGAGTELLRNVERYHVVPAGEKLRTHQYESAQGDIDFILRYFPNHPQGLSLLIQLCEVRKSAACAPELMADRFERAVAVNPDAAATYVAQGIFQFRMKKLPAATASLEKAVTLDPDSVNAQYNLGLVYFEARRYELANVHAQRAYQLGTSLPGLRDKLKRAGQWKPLEAPQPDVTPSASSESGNPPTVR